MSSGPQPRDPELPPGRAQREGAAPRRRQRRLALGVLLGAAALALAAMPASHTWWGGWILAIAEAGIVGGLADWFAVTALFRRPLGLPIPHTALIPANWELLAQRVGTMVGNQVLTRDYVSREISRLDFGDLLARAADRLTRADLEVVTRRIADWIAEQLPELPTGDLAALSRRLIREWPVAPALATALDVAREQGWDRRAVDALTRALADAIERPAVRDAIADVVDDLLARYRESMGTYPRLFMGVAQLFGLLDRERIVTALRRGLQDVARDPHHPLRAQVAQAIGELPGRLRDDPKLAARLEAVKEDLLGAPFVGGLVQDAVDAVTRALVVDLRDPRSGTVTWLTDQLDAARQRLGNDEPLRRDLDAWIKRSLLSAVDRHHGRLAAFIENGVRALGAAGAVKLIEEHAGDDLQYIRVNGTVVGGLAGGALYALHLLLRAW
jgi:uncharacterized membrane-anchored protein YjiN (DUF445 family)